MNEQELNEQEQSEALLQPVSVEETNAAMAQQAGIEIPAGHVLIVALNANGDEIEGSGFFYPEERTYKRFYSDEARFLVKKKL